MLDLAKDIKKYRIVLVKPDFDLEACSRPAGAPRMHVAFEN